MKETPNEVIEMREEISIEDQQGVMNEGRISMAAEVEAALAKVR